MSNGNSNGGDEELLMLAIILAILIGLGFLMWHLFKPQITNTIRYVRIAEMEIARQFFAPDNYGVQYPGITKPILLDGMQDFLKKAPVEAITTQHIAISSDLAQRKLRVPLGIAILLMAGIILVRGPHFRFKQRHNLQSLMERQVKAFPYIAPLIDFNPRDIPNRAPGDPVPVKLPLFSEALSPEEWLAYNRITSLDTEEGEAAATEAFTKQLGGRFVGWQKLPAWMQILLASFAMRAARKRDDSDKLLGRMALCWTAKGGLNLGKDAKMLSEARAFLRSKPAEPILKVMRQHAFVTTAMMRALDFARSQGGVLSPGQFIWLRGHNRELWYPLNNVGRQAFHAEALGAMSHFRLEKSTQRPVPLPKLERAIKAVREYLKSPMARPIPPLDYGKGGPPANQKPTARKAGIMRPAA